MGNCLKICCSWQETQEQVSGPEKKISTGASQTVLRSSEKLEDFRWPSVVLTTRQSSIEVSGKERSDNVASAVVEVSADVPNMTTKEADKSSKKQGSWLSNLRAKTNSDGTLNSSVSSQLASRTEDGKLRSHPSMAWSYHCSRGARSLQVFQLEGEEDTDITEITEQPTNSYDAGRGLLELLKVRVDMAANNMEINGILKRLDEMSGRTRRRLQNLKRRLNGVGPAPMEPTEESTPPSKPRICWE